METGNRKPETGKRKRKPDIGEAEPEAGGVAGLTMFVRLFTRDSMRRGSERARAC